MIYCTSVAYSHFIVFILNSNSVIIMNDFFTSKTVYLLFSICFSCSFTLLRQLRYIISQAKISSIRYTSHCYIKNSQRNKVNLQNENKASVFHIHRESVANIFFYYLLGTITHKNKKSSVNHGEFLQIIWSIQIKNGNDHIFNIRLQAWKA